MAEIRITPSPPPPPPPPPPVQAPGAGGILFAYGFRPFFLLAPLWGALAIGLWLATRAGWIETAWSLPPAWVHGHEMLFGFLAAAAAGFLLTAVPNWTQVTRVHGPILMILVGCWLLGRLFILLLAGISPELTAVLDLLFLLLLAVATLAPVIRSRRYHQAPFPALLLLLWLGNALVHSEALGIVEAGARTGLYLGVDAMVWFFILFGERMFPNFTRDGLGHQARLTAFSWVERSVHWVMGATVVLELAAGYFPAARPLLGGLLLILGVLLGLRLAGWRPWLAWRAPMLWSLHLGYAWLAVGLILRGVAEGVGWIDPSTALHAITVGAFGITLLGIMTRVCLAHTGRPVRAPGFVVGLFVLILVAGLLRVGLASWAPELAAGLSGGLWILALMGFFLFAAPILTRPRADGKPG